MQLISHMEKRVRGYCLVGSRVGEVTSLIFWVIVSCLICLLGGNVLIQSAVFLKSVYVVFDQGNTRIGVAQRTS